MTLLSSLLKEMKHPLAAHREFLALSGNELRMLEALDEPMHIAALARKIRVSRTTLYSSLKKLRKRKLVRAVASGKRTKWMAISWVEQAAIVERLHASLKGTAPGERRIELSSKSEVTVHKGATNLQKLYQKLFFVRRHERVTGLQPSRSAALAIKKIPFLDLLAINKHLQEHKVIVESVLHEDAIPQFMQGMVNAQYSEKMMAEMTAALGNRLAQTTYIPKEFMDVKCEMCFTQKAALLVHWEEEIAIEIKNPDFVSMLEQLFKLVQHFGKAVDQNPKLAALLVKASIPYKNK